MGGKRQQGSGDQKDLFDQALQASLCLGVTGEGGTGPGACAEPQALTAFEQQRALTQKLMEEVAGSANLNQAYKRVKANRGAAGVDAMSIAELLPWLRENRDRLIASLLDGSCQPQTVRGVPRYPQSRRWDTPTWHPDGGGPPGSASDPASPGADPRSDLLVVELRLPPGEERPSSARPGPELRR